MQIRKIEAKKIKDSRGEETIEVSVNGCKASSPSGKSTGSHETPSYHRSLSWNVKATSSLNIPFEITSFNDLKKVEQHIKKTFRLKDAKQFGANALFALESAMLKALAKEQKKQLWQLINARVRSIPIPIGNAIGGGLHSHIPHHPLFQEFLLIPRASTAKENVRILQHAHARLKHMLNAKQMNDEGAWETSLSEALLLGILYVCYDHINIGVDIAASTFYNKAYIYPARSLTSNQQIFHINALINQFDLFYVEDPLHEEDFKGFAKITKNKRHLVVGDDLTATHLSRIKKAVAAKALNAVILKPNQNGSLIELKEIFAFCKKHGITTILSHRSGETLDNALADYAVGLSADYIKCGIATPWREVKLMRLVEIEKEMRQ